MYMCTCAYVHCLLFTLLSQGNSRAYKAEQTTGKYHYWCVTLKNSSRDRPLMH